MKVYIAGPMRGYREYNFPAFDYAERCLAERGFEVINPAALDRELGFDERGLKGDEDLAGLGFSLERAFERDIEAIISCNAIMLLPGWENSSGANFELQTAQRLGKQIYLCWYPNDRPLELLTGEDFVTYAAGDFPTWALPGEAPAEAAEAPPKGEVRHTSESGGQKGRKPARFSLIPPEALWELAEVYGAGAEKYEDHNWRKGYPWAWSIDALERHLQAWKAGEDLDPETGKSHLAHVAWHCFTLLEFARMYPENDDRIKSRSLANA